MVILPSVIDGGGLLGAMHSLGPGASGRPNARAPSEEVPIRARFLLSDRVILGAVMEAPRDTSASTELLIRSGTEDDSRGVLRLWRNAETAPSDR
jgi:hypothetical protein